ncbi:tripartite motif-containing protein 16-like [Ictalurus punctatus]|uniref:Tripartite motif-containing protein 16-like n=1 Tax=Ictalurus punctatus TaxID=7998 RepID=A0A9F7TQA8_ICTPU|nr:tripartite motif-containing protein 16-like [Ictalurus punctatus]
MAEASISVDQEEFICPVCLDLLKDPVTIPCGHSYCKVCINDYWDQEDENGVYRCPQCRDTFTPRPVLRRNNMLAEVVEKLKKKTEIQAASPAHCYAGPGDVECDFCTGRKHKAVKSCLMCLASFCETHLKPHYEVPGLKKHKLVEASGNLQEKICSEHEEVLKIYCRTDQSFICYLCMTDEHKSHDTVSVKAYRTEKQVRVLVSGRRSPEIIRPSFQSDLREDSRSITVNQRLSFDGVRESLSALKKRIEEFCLEEFIRIPEHDTNLITLNCFRLLHHLIFPSPFCFCVSTAAAVHIILPPEPKSRQDFLQYFCDLTLDPNTVNYYLILSERNRAVTRSERKQQYSDHPERFDYYSQVLSKESVCGRCYWEVEWSGAGVYISVSYKDISRKGWGNECVFGGSDQSWSLWCYSSSLCFWHNNIKTDLRVPSSSRIGVYVDHSAGTLSFYSVSDTMKLLHRVHTTFTQTLYAGFWLPYRGSTVRLCDSK